MTALLLQYLKLIMLFALIGSIIGLSHFNGEKQNGSGSAAARHTHSPAKARKILDRRRPPRRDSRSPRFCA